ncbi:amino acid ABC transporter permease, partial [Streptococcus pyogenes]
VVTATYSPISPLLVAAFYYLMVTTVMAQLLAVLERHMAQGGNH